MIKPTYICKSCIQSLESRGEQFAIAINYEDDNEEITACEWCGEEVESSDELKPVFF